jgi:hypothetical protein
MRTTLTLSEDAILYARQTAQAEDISLGEAVSRLIRRGSLGGHKSSPDKVSLNGPFSLLPDRGETITTAHVRAIMDDLGI